MGGYRVTHEQPEQIPVAWLHTYKKPGKMYTLADLSEHGPEPDEGFEHVGKQPLYIQPSSAAQARVNSGELRATGHGQQPGGKPASAGPTPELEPLIKVGDFVRKYKGDYKFAGTAVSVFRKSSGVVRYVVENDDGILHIFSESQLIPPAARDTTASKERMR